MEEVITQKNQAQRYLYLADHMLTQTYPLVRDNKLLLPVLKNIFLGMQSAMDSVLTYERLYKRIPAYPDNFESKIRLFREKIVTRKNLDVEMVKLMRELHEIIQMHKKSPVEFQRKDAFVICSSDYRMKTFTANDLKKYLLKAKLFIKQLITLLENK
ncbi:hypothetical protein GOV04_05500 [Candidatus Woesearchaeota archaeon]|nr:hypothetical protein [Candidatus Woesearchaeota archaeon]